VPKIAILLSADSFEGFYGGVIGIDREQYLQDYRHDFSWYYARALRAQGIEAVIYIPSWIHAGRFDTWDGFAVRFLPLRRFFKLWEKWPVLGRTPAGRYVGKWANTAAFLPALNEGLRHDKIDLLYIQEYWSARFDLLAFRLGRKLPLIGADHGGTRHRQLTFLKRASFRRAFALTAQTHNECKEVEAFGRPALYLPNGVDSDFYRPLGKARETYVLTVARLTDRQKRVSDLIRALALLPGSWRLKIAGRGPDEGMLRALAQELNVADRVDFLGFLNDRQTLLELYSTCGVFALVSANEGLPMAMLEAMSSGAPVVASAIRAFDGLVEHGGTGLRVPVGDIPAIASALAAAHEQAASLGEAARKLIVQRYSQTAMAVQLKALFDDALQSNGAA
jgi:glycosyltransferase involved in cell wall biosynthesis